MPPIGWSDRRPGRVERALVEVDAAIGLVQRGTAQVVLVSGVGCLDELIDDAREHARLAHVRLEVAPGAGDGGPIHLVVGPRDA